MKYLHKSYIIMVLILFSFSSKSLSKSENSISLNGIWYFKLDPDSAMQGNQLHVEAPNPSTWDQLSVPGNWDTENRYAHYIGRAFYNKSFQIPPGWQQKKILLNFNAVYETAEVWLNGNYLGKHVGGYTPFEFDISGVCHFNSENTLIVSADNTYGRGAWWKWGGISRDVTLTQYNNVRILYTHIEPDVNLEKRSVKLKIHYRIINYSDQSQKVKLGFKICKTETDELLDDFSETHVQSCEIEPGKEKSIVAHARLNLTDYELWHFDSPTMYQLISTISEEENNFIHHSTSEKFGIRKLEVSGTQLLLNGEPIRVNGFNRVHDHRIYGNTEPITLVTEDIDNMKSLGGVFSRIMHGPQATQLLDYCDEKGYLIIEEIPVWGGGDPQTFPDNPLTKKWLQEMITRDFNHPCIIGWSVANEISDPRAKSYSERVMSPAQYEYIKTMIQYIKTELDSSRFGEYVSYSAFRDAANNNNEPAEYADILNVNCYGVAPDQVRAVHKKWPNKPIFVSEYGKSQVGLDRNMATFKPQVTEYMDSLRTFDYVIGTSLWTYNDYRSRYRGTPASENRAWGVYNVWRQPKRAATQIKNEYAPVKDITLEINNKNDLQVSIIPRASIDIPSYVLKNYQLEIARISKHNESKLIAEQLIHEIKPGDDILKFSYKLDDLSDFDAYIRANLVIPTGISIYTSKYDLNIPDAPQIKDIIAANNSIRVLFDVKIGADTYMAYYGEHGTMNSTYQTINNHIDILNLDMNKRYRVCMVAINSQGESHKSDIMEISTNDLILPPVIWKTVPVTGGFYVGYSVDENDIEFEIKYGKESNKYSTTINEIKLKGAYKIDSLERGEIYYYRLRRVTASGVSNWSQEESVLIP